MPDSRQLLADGVRAERTGATLRALDAYQAAAANSADPAVLAEAHTRIADVQRERCMWEDALAAARRARAIADEASLVTLSIEAQIAEANVLMCRGDFALAMDLFDTIATQADEPRVRGVALQNLGSMLAQLGRHGEAERAFKESLGNFQRAGYERGQIIALNNLGRFALDRRDFDEARHLLERAVAQATEFQDNELAALANQNLAGVLCEAGEVERAQELAASALGYFTETENRWREIECLRLLGALNERQNDPTSARRCYERALARAREIGSEVEIRVTQHRLDRLSRH